MPFGIAAAGIGAAGAIGGALLNSSASKSAAGQQSAAANQASAMTQRQFDQTQNNLSPFTNQAYQAQGQLAADLGLDPAGAVIGSTYSGQPVTAGSAENYTNLLQPYQFQSFDPTQAQLENLPGYQFELGQGELGVANSAAAQGKGISGDALKGAASYAQGLASSDLNSYYNIFNQNQQQGYNIFTGNQQNIYNKLAATSTQGQNDLLGVGNQGVAATANSANALVGGANAQAAGTVGSANALSGAANSLGSAPLNYALYNQLLNNGSGQSLATPTTGDDSF